MFKKVIKSLSKALGPGAKASETAASRTSAAAEYEEAPEAASPEIAAALAGPQEPEQIKLEPTLPPDELCGITPEMSSEDVREQLAFLYRRYNRAASSLDPHLRAESEMMLDAIVAVREQHFGPI
jgi:hypothetical protein